MIAKQLEKLTDVDDLAISDEAIKIINSNIENNDSKVWNKWRSRIRSKRSAESSKRRDIGEEALEYLEKYSSKNQSSAKQILNGLGKEYLLVNNEVGKKVNNIIRMLKQKGGSQLSDTEILHFLHIGLMNNNVSNNKKFMRWIKEKTT